MCIHNVWEFLKLIIHQRKSQQWKRFGIQSKLVFFQFFSLLLIEKIKTLISVSLAIQTKFQQKYSTAHWIFNFLPGVWIFQWNTVSCEWYITSVIVKTSNASAAEQYLKFHLELTWKTYQQCSDLYLIWTTTVL